MDNNWTKDFTSSQLVGMALTDLHHLSGERNAHDIKRSIRWGYRDSDGTPTATVEALTELASRLGTE